MLQKGLFKNLIEPSPRIPLYVSPQCGACRLDQSCDSPHMEVDGDGKKKILIVGEGPGEQEDLKGRPFVGTTGSLLKDTLASFGVDMRRDCWITNAIRCRAWQWNKNKTRKENRSPTDKEIAWCRPHLTGNGDRYGIINQLKPRVIILLGGPAVKSVIGWLWREDPGGVNRWAGWCVPDQQTNAYVCPTWHPSYVARSEKNRAVSLLWKQHLQAACALPSRPWPKGPPDYAGRVTVEMAPSQAAHLIREVVRLGRVSAFDYETTTLKPDSAQAEIVSCAISNGLITVAYPWHGEAVRATQEFLQSPLPKVGTNTKFEQRWTMKYFGHKVRNFNFCTMLAAHLLDNRPEVSSVKFQAFVLLGQPSWDDVVKPYLQSSGSNTPNRIRKLDPRMLLLYNGLDSLLELEVAKIQAQQLGVSLERDGVSSAS